MDSIKIKAIRHLVWHCLSPHTAEFAGLTLSQLQQFAAGAFTPSEEQLRALARYLRIEQGLVRS